MTTVIRWFSPFLVYLMLSGCSSLPMLTMPKSEETKLFAQGMDQYIESGDLTTLKLLPQVYPRGEWRDRAEGIIDMAEETELFTKGMNQYIQSRDLKTLKQLPKKYPQGEWRDEAEGIIEIAEQQRQQQSSLAKKSEELAHTLQEKEVLFEDNKILEVTLERLKQVLIDMELRAE